MEDSDWTDNPLISCVEYKDSNSDSDTEKNTVKIKKLLKRWSREMTLNFKNHQIRNKRKNHVLSV